MHYLTATNKSYYASQKTNTWYKTPILLSKNTNLYHPYYLTTKNVQKISTKTWHSHAHAPNPIHIGILLWCHMKWRHMTKTRLETWKYLTWTQPTSHYFKTHAFKDLINKLSNVTKSHTNDGLLSFIDFEVNEQDCNL